MSAAAGRRLRIRRGSGGSFLANVISLAGATAITLPLGFVFWTIAAHLYTAHSVGLASAAISAMLLVAALADLGFGTFLIGELPRRPGHGAPLLVSALLVVFGAGALLGLIFAVVAGGVSQRLSLLSSTVWAVLLFAVGVGLSTSSVILDHALASIMRGWVQFWRNATVGVVKIVALALVAAFIASGSGMTILGAWVFGLALSMLLVAGIFVHEGHSPRNWRPRWSVVLEVKRAAALHHALNLTLAAPLYVLPIIATTLVSPRYGAYFYAAWMIGGVVMIIPWAYTTMLFAISAADLDLLRERTRHTLKWSLVAATATVLGLFVAGPLVLHAFGRAYATHAAIALRLVALGGLPLVIKYHFVAVSRALNRLARALGFIAVGTMLELAGAALGAKLDGLEGLAGLWLAVVTCEAVVMGIVLYRVALR